MLLFGLFSSPALVGFVDCAILLALALLTIKNRERSLSYAAALLLLIAVYCVLYRGLILEAMDHDYVGHREEFVLSVVTDIWGSVKSIWNGGQPHAISNHRSFIPWVLAVQLIGLLTVPFKGKEKAREQVAALTVIVITAFLIAVFYAGFHSAAVVNIRNLLGGTLKSFQFDRVYWLYPGLWFTAFGLTVSLMWDPLARFVGFDKVKGKKARCFIAVSRAASGVLCAVLLLTTANRMWDESNCKRNVESLINDRPVSVSFHSFYSSELFSEIERYIDRPKSEYRVASIALFPSVPLYNGYSCVDGYSNNYPLEYKHRFRDVIALELEKNETIRKYFDEWGNRCYLFSAELGQKYYFTKDYPGMIHTLQLNGAALRQLGCEYVFAGVEIENAAENELVLLRTFEDGSSPYRIWLYQLSAEKKEF